MKHGGKYGYKKAAYGKAQKRGQAKGESAYKGHVKFSGRVDFHGCTADYCKMGAYEGFDCKDGKCTTICKGEKCYKEVKEVHGYDDDDDDDDGHYGHDDGKKFY